MKTNLIRINTRFWQKYYLPFRWWLITNLVVLFRHRLHTLVLKDSYPFLKWIGWMFKYSFVTRRYWSYVDLWKQGLFMTPSSPEGDEPKEEPPEVGDEAAWYPFKPVPNVRHFEIELKAFDPLFAMFGIRKRFSPSIKFEKFSNHKYNRYMECQLRRLEDARIGKLASEDDFTSVYLQQASNKKIIKIFNSLVECSEWLSDSPDDGNFLDTAYFYELLLSDSTFSWKGKRVFLRKKFRAKEWSELTYECKERVDKGSSTVKVRRYKPNKKLYFKIVDSLLKHSRVFFMRQVMLTEPRWHREIPYYKIRKWWLAHRKIARDASRCFDTTDMRSEDAPKLKYRRVFIPKANGKLRPLGVPSHVWRIYLGQWNKFLLKWLNGRINEHQHAYQPNRGVTTVWQDIMENIINKRNIYSYDLEKYFDKVNLNSAVRTLSNTMDVPWSIAYCLGEMHKELPTNYKLFVESPLPGVTMLKSIVGALVYNAYLNRNRPSVPEDNLKQYITETDPWIGIPQGGSISPLLAIVLQESEFFPKIEKQGASVAKYSDDGIVASNNDNWVPDLTVSEQGIKESKEKSYWVKRKGKWLKPLDFCGLRYDGALDKIIANTRSGSRLELQDVQDLVPLLALRELVPLLVEQGKIPEKELRNPGNNPPPYWVWEYVKKKWSSPKDIVKHQVWGLLQSRLFSDSWELEDYKQDFRLTASRGSLVGCHYKQLRTLGVNVFTSTSWAFPVAIDDLGAARRQSLQRWRLKSLNKNKNKK